jgi:hypothetical protein
VEEASPVAPQVAPHEGRVGGTSGGLRHRVRDLERPLADDDALGGGVAPGPGDEDDGDQRADGDRPAKGAHAG